LKREPQAVLRNLAVLLERRRQELVGSAVPRRLP
jgi:hypothetical protein